MSHALLCVDSDSECQHVHAPQTVRIFVLASRAAVSIRASSLICNESFPGLLISFFCVFLLAMCVASPDPRTKMALRVPLATALLELPRQKFKLLRHDIQAILGAQSRGHKLYLLLPTFSLPDLPAFAILLCPPLPHRTTPEKETTPH
jgi:hypothetical protein